jgi:DNA-binding PadR family transcriptional regulator
MSQGPPITSWALLGLLTLGDEALTGYELKARADNTMRFYWTAPTMSHVYTELGRLRGLGYVDVEDSPGSGGRATSYRINEAGRKALREWLRDAPPAFPVLKHAPALRLMIGRVADDAEMADMLRAYLLELDAARSDLRAVRETLRGDDGPDGIYRYPALVADWGLTFFDAEETSARRTLAALEADADP